MLHDSLKRPKGLMTSKIFKDMSVRKKKGRQYWQPPMCWVLQLDSKFGNSWLAR